MDLYVVMTDFSDLDDGDEIFEGVFTHEEAVKYVEKINEMYSSNVAYWEKIELNKPINDR